LVEFVNIYNLFEIQNVINLNMYSDVAKGGGARALLGAALF